MPEPASETELLLRAAQTTSRIASRLITTPEPKIADTVRDALGELGTAYGIDRAYLVAFGGGFREVLLAEEWTAPGIDAVLPDLFSMDDSAWAWWATRLASGDPLVVSPPEGMRGAPPEAVALVEQERIGTIILIPIVAAEQVRGVLAVSVVERRLEVAPDALELLRLVAQAFVNRLARAQAERALEAVSRELEARNADLLRSNRELEDFAYVASHDLKSPLMIIEGFLELLATSKAHLLDDEARSFVDTAKRGAERMARLIDELLAYSRAGPSPPELTEVDLRRLVEAVAMDRSHHGGVAHVEIGELPVVRGEPTMLRQLVDNLLSNATKFVAPGTTPVIRVGADVRDDHATVWVADNGFGIAADDRDRVFEMFTRLDEAREHEGSGIGLAICQRVVRAHGGTIWIDGAAPHEGGGTKVSFTLPLA